MSLAPNPFIDRLSRFPGVRPDDLQALEAAFGDRRIYPHHAQIMAQEEPNTSVHVVLEGWTARARILKDGRRQLPAMLLPGDAGNLDGLLLGRLNYGLVALTRCVIATAPHERLRPLLAERPALKDLLLWITFIDNSVTSEWLINVGRRSALERLAHLFCELQARLGHAAREQEPFAFELTQMVLADLLGLSVVHVNRSLQSLRADGLIALRRGRITLLDMAGLRRLSGFDPGYLHLPQARAAA